MPLLLIARQPDLGTAVTLIPVCFGIAYLAGLRMRLIAVLALVAVLMAPVAWEFALKDYQKTRITTFLNPDLDPQGDGYQQSQARITVGSGGLTGKGFMKGTQGQYKFLPVAHNDFIFSVLAEEKGFIGVLVALGLYLFVILRSLEAARLSKDRIGAYLVGGIIAGFAFQVIYNITMSAGLAPVKGIDAAADELRRLVDDRDAGGLWPHPQREDAAVHQLARISLSHAIPEDDHRSAVSSMLIARGCLTVLAGCRACGRRVAA